MTTIQLSHIAEDKRFAKTYFDIESASNLEIQTLLRELEYVYHDVLKVLKERMSDGGEE